VWKLIYSILISLVFLLFSFYYTKTSEINEEYFFLIGIIFVPIFYNLINLPLWFFMYNMVFKRRLFAYFISCIGSSFIFSIAYMKFSGVNNEIFLSVIYLSFILFFVASILYFSPIELNNFIKRNNIVSKK
jgi:hypothetical protein